MLTNVRDNALRQSYAGITDFDGMQWLEYPLAYCDAGSLISDAGRRIARMGCDLLINSVCIQFTNGRSAHRDACHSKNVTEYVYSTSGQKLRVVHYTAIPNITRPLGVQPAELTGAQIQYKDSTDYLLGGCLVMKDGRIGKMLFDGGYCQVTSTGSLEESFILYYYNRDHLGNIREVVNGSGSVRQVMRSTSGRLLPKGRKNYYPFGTPYSNATGASNPGFQPYKYNGKELDLMHGLNAYDYGARQYNPVLARWDRVDPLCEKYYSISPYAYCSNNPINAIDPNGKELFLAGSYMQRMVLFCCLQLLTNDNLGMKKNGEVFIESKGTRNQDKQLSTGTALVSSLISHQHKATIHSTFSKSRCHNLSSEIIKDEKGKDVSVFLNFENQYQYLVNDSNTGDSMLETPPLYISLGHELVHGLRSMNGIDKNYDDKSYYFYKDEEGQMWKTKARVEELETTGIAGDSDYTENKLRKEHGLNERIKY